MAKYNLKEKKEKQPLYRALINQEIVEDLYEKLKESAEKIREKDAELEKFKSLLIANGIEIDK